MVGVHQGRPESHSVFLLAKSFGEEQRSSLKPKFLAVSSNVVFFTHLVAGLLVWRLRLASPSSALCLSGLANYEAFGEHCIAI